MTIIEQINAEIERLKNANEISDNEAYAQYELDVACGYDMALNDVISFLSTLEESKKPIISNDLEEAAKEYAGDSVSDEGIMEVAAFIAGAEWDREQMMSKAVECIVEDWNPEPHPEITIPLNPGKFSNGDIARIIIVEED